MMYLGCYLSLFLALSLSSRISNGQAINVQTLGTSSVLTIANVTEGDYGNYTCVATNRLGIQSASLFLYSKLPYCCNRLCSGVDVLSIDDK